MALIICAGCGVLEDARLVDSKPSDGDWECGDYDRHECVACYGPGYAMLDPRHAGFSRVPALAPLYAAWVERQRLRGVVWC